MFYTNSDTCYRSLHIANLPNSRDKHFKIERQQTLFGYTKLTVLQDIKLPEYRNKFLKLGEMHWHNFICDKKILFYFNKKIRIIVTSCREVEKKVITLVNSSARNLS